VRFSLLFGKFLIIVYFAEVLPIVEFELEEGLSDEEAVRLIEAPATSGGGNQWSSSQGEDYQVLQLQEEVAPDPFTLRLTNYEVSSSF